MSDRADELAELICPGDVDNPHISFTRGRISAILRKEFADQRDESAKILENASGGTDLVDIAAAIRNRDV